MVGRTPWSARVPPDLLIANEISFIHWAEVDEGVGCGPGGPPHHPRRPPKSERVYGSWLEARSTAVARPFPAFPGWPLFAFGFS